MAKVGENAAQLGQWRKVSLRDPSSTVFSCVLDRVLAQKDSCSLKSLEGIYPSRQSNFHLRFLPLGLENHPGEDGVHLLGVI
jgi:hypothetical protein